MQGIEKCGNRISQWVVSHPWGVILLTTVIAGLIGSGARFLEFSTNYRVFFSEDNPQLAAFTSLENIYTKTDNVLFVIKPNEGDVFQPKVLSLVQELTEAAWQLPYSQRVDSLSNFQHTYAEEDDLIVEDLVYGDPGELTENDFQAIKNIALNEPLLVNRIVSDTGLATGVNVTINLPREDMYEVPDTAAKARELAAAMRAKYPDIEIRLSGMLFMNNAFVESSMRDLETLIPIMYGVLLLILMIALRRVAAVLATLVVIFFSASSALGFGGWIGYPMTPPSSTVSTIVLTLAIADSVHVIISMLKAMQHGMDKRTAIIESLRINFTPIFLTSLTTMIGFLSLNFSETPPFWHLGNMTAFGIGAAFLYSVIFLPALLMLVPIAPPKAREEKGASRMLAMANFAIEHNKILLVGGLIVIIAIGSMIRKIEINDQFVQYFDHSIDFRPDTEFMVEHLTGVYTMEFSVPASGSSAINEPTYLQTIDEFSHFLRQQPETRHVFSITDIFKRLNKNMHGDDDAWYRLPDSRELAAQYLLLYELSLPYGLDLNDRINIDKSASRVTVTLNDMPTKQVQAFKTRAETWLANNAEQYMQTQATSSVVMFAYISERNIKSMIKGNLLSLLLISLVIMLALRSFKIGMLSLLPNILPIVLGYGIWGLLVGQINLTVAICSAVSLGIIVDDSVHFLSKYLRARREKSFSSIDAIRYAFSTVGTALVVTTVVLMFGFATLAQSAFQLNGYLGWLTFIIIACALIADFLLLPALLMRIDEGTEERAV